jgi:hypothetical protein
MFDDKDSDDNDENEFELTSLLVCLQVYNCPATHNASYLGIVRGLAIESFPSILPKLVVAYRGIASPGEYRLRISVEHEQDGTQRVFDRIPPFSISTDVRAKPVHGDISISEIPVKSPGLIWFKFHVNGRFLGQRALEIAPRPHPLEANQ